MLGHLEARIHASTRNIRSAKGLGKRSVAQSIETNFRSLKMSNSSLTNSVRFALATAATASLSQLSMQSAMAQEQDQDANESMEEVIVTGSRVRRLDTESASPIVTIDKASIERSGVTTAGHLLQR